MFVRVALARPANPVRVAVVVGIVLIGVNVLIWAGRSQVNGPANVQRNPEIALLEPNESDQLLPQGEVGVQLKRADLAGQITIDGRVIPQDQITGDPNLGQVLFDPGPGKDIREFSKGGHTANGKTEKLLTGDVAAKVKAAALAKVSGTVERVETNVDSSAPYEAHIRKADGSEVIVYVDNDYNVTGTGTMGQP